MIGALIVLDHVVCGSSIVSSLERFKKLSNRIFPRRSYSCFALPRQLIDWLSWWFSDNKYDSGVLKDVVQDAFGIRQRLFDAESQHQSGIKISITATTVSNSKLRLFTNYNEVSRKRQGRGKFRWYYLVRCSLVLRLRHAATPSSFRGTISLGNVGLLWILLGGLTNVRIVQDAPLQHQGKTKSSFRGPHTDFEQLLSAQGSQILRGSTGRWYKVK